VRTSNRQRGRGSQGGAGKAAQPEFNRLTSCSPGSVHTARRPACGQCFSRFAVVPPQPGRSSRTEPNCMGALAALQAAVGGVKDQLGCPRRGGPAGSAQQAKLAVRQIAQVRDDGGRSHRGAARNARGPHPGTWKWAAAQSGCAKRKGRACAEFRGDGPAPVRRMQRPRRRWVTSTACSATGGDYGFSTTLPLKLLPKQGGQYVPARAV
jgi:hypothetical protein